MARWLTGQLWNRPSDFFYVIPRWQKGGGVCFWQSLHHDPIPCYNTVVGWTCTFSFWSGLKWCKVFSFALIPCLTSKSLNHVDEASFFLVNHWIIFLMTSVICLAGSFSFTGLEKEPLFFSCKGVSWLAIFWKKVKPIFWRIITVFWSIGWWLSPTHLTSNLFL